MVSDINKLYISLQAAFVFVVVASPSAYGFTARLHEVAPKPLQHLMLHGLIYMLIVRYMMGEEEKITNDMIDPNYPTIVVSDPNEQDVDQNITGFADNYYYYDWPWWFDLISAARNLIGTINYK